MKFQSYTRLTDRQRRLVSILIGTYVVLLLNSLLLVVFEQSTALFYMSLVLFHVGVGILLVAPVVVFLVMHVSHMPLRENKPAVALGIFTAASLSSLLATGIGLAVLGSSYQGGWMLVMHIITAVTSILGFIIHISLKFGVRYHFLEWGQARAKGLSTFMQHPLSLTVAVGVVLSLFIAAFPLLSGNRAVYVTEGNDNIDLMESQAGVAHSGFLSDLDLAESERCGDAGCHPDVYDQWAESAHRFSSFNNPWYRKSIEYLVERKGNETAAWCASCHDPLVLFTGRMEAEVPMDMDHWTAQSGLTCLSCHAIEGLKDVKGNGRYVISKPDEYPFARSDNESAQWLHQRLIKTKPEAHRTAMLKPVHQTAEFCGTCHKVGLPPTVNDYKWKRGQNQYDSWHASGVSGNTVRSFYLPPSASNCVTCHMPLVPSDDMGNDDGFIRSHRFVAANTAIPALNDFPEQMAATVEMLQDSIVTLDVFMVEVNGQAYGPEDAMPVLRGGDRVDVDVVVRNRKVGHRFPAGTNDSNEIWVTLEAQNEAGEPLLISGKVQEDGQVDSTAHFFGGVLVDRASQLIDKRNAQDWKATVYANVINPGTARTVHYSFVVPAGQRIQTLEASLHYRKFKWYFHNFTFRGQPAPGQPDSLLIREVERRAFMLNDNEAPDIPITQMALTTRTAGEVPLAHRPLWERWNDYGIGLFLEGSAREALPAFEEVAERDNGLAEGYINQARVLLNEGQINRAAEVLEEAERTRPGYLKTAYFRGQVHKANAEYPEALTEWERVAETYPNDRVLLLDIARIHYLSGDYEAMLPWLDRVLTVDPEDIGALYNRMLALGALGMDEELAEARELYLYHKDDEDELTATAGFKQAHPNANREAQAIHVHELHRVGN